MKMNKESVKNVEKLEKEISTNSHLAGLLLVSPKVSYLERESKPDVNYFYFSYKICITNNSKVPVQLISRYWLITDANGQEEEVRGAGVVGQQPVIAPGQTYEYESNCPCATASCSMRGAYQMLAPSTNERFEVQIPEFYLIAPFALH